MTYAEILAALRCAHCGKGTRGQRSHVIVDLDGWFYSCNDHHRAERCRIESEYLAADQT